MTGKCPGATRSTMAAIKRNINSTYCMLVRDLQNNLFQRLGVRSSVNTSVLYKPFTCKRSAHSGILHACGQTSDRCSTDARNHPGGGNDSHVTRRGFVHNGAKARTDTSTLFDTLAGTPRSFLRMLCRHWHSTR